MARVTIVETAALADTAAQRLTELIEDSIAVRGTAIVSLTGGTTPRATYATLADPSRPWRERIDWSRVHLFWGDERHVPPDHPDSNFGMAERALLQHVPIPAAQVHRMRGELPDAHDAARQYDAELRAGFAAAGRDDLTFDVMLLGLGEDAHIASIFPDHGSFSSTERVAAIYATHLDAWRITLTPAAILDSRAIVMLVSGEAKAAAVAAALEAPADVTRYPAQRLRPAGDRVEWLLDRAAAARLRDVPTA